MTQTIVGVLGGVGLFLLGMILLTDGLKNFAGDGLRRALVRFTGTPLKAFLSGTLVTLLVQSSSATTVAVIGFVSAGLLTFPQALGVVFGASLGTTGTGWIVSVLGLKVSVGAYALPFVATGAFLKLLTRGRWAAFGMALAGFGLIFIGISTLQQGMDAFSGIFPLASLPSSGLLGHLIAMAVGIVLTVILQSSSAAVATTLTALHAGALNFEQAASLVTGAAIGTTVTAALASIGATAPAKRTAVAFVIFNTVTGLVAIILLPAFLAVLAWAQRHLGLEPGAVSLAAFHSSFIAMGVVLFLPWVKGYAGLIERLIPDRDPKWTRHLDRSLHAAPGIALETCSRTLKEIADAAVQTLKNKLCGRAERVIAAEELGASVTRVRDFLAETPIPENETELAAARVSLFHAVDHLLRLRSRLASEPLTEIGKNSPQLAEEIAILEQLLCVAAEILGSTKAAQQGGVCGGGDEAALGELAKLAQQMAENRKSRRETILAEVGCGAHPQNSLELLDALRWLERVAYHTWRAVAHLTGSGGNSTAEIVAMNDAE